MAKWLESIVGKLNQKQVSDRQAYVALLFKAARSGELSEADQSKLSALVEGMNITAEQLQTDSALIAEHVAASKLSAKRDGIDGELSKLEADHLQLARELEAIQAQTHTKVTKLLDRKTQLNTELIGVNAATSRVAALEAERPDLFEVAE